jgi:hypothetical protein
MARRRASRGGGRRDTVRRIECNIEVLQKVSFRKHQTSQTRLDRVVRIVVAYSKGWTNYNFPCLEYRVQEPRARGGRRRRVQVVAVPHAGNPARDTATYRQRDGRARAAHARHARLGVREPRDTVGRT